MSQAKQPLRVLAFRINEHLYRFERDPVINAKSEARGVEPYYHAWARHNGGRYLSVSYISFQGVSHLTTDEAVRYVAMLDAGFVGRHHEALRNEKEWWEKVERRGV